jgi:predicted AAA+ superfamily ATPase
VEKAAAVDRVVAIIDEVQLLPDWSARLKGRWDLIVRKNLPVHVVASGSSALMLAMESRESLAGRFERLTISHWSARSLSEVFGMGAEEAAEAAVRFGTFPGAVVFRGDLPRLLAYVRDAIIDPAIGRDILSTAQVKKPALLKQVFSVCAVSPARIVSLQKLQGQLQDPGALQTVSYYLSLLEEAFLVAPLQKYHERPIKRRGSPPKLVALSNAFMAVMDPGTSAGPMSGELFGTWVENACLAQAWNSGQQVWYWREEPLEVDGVIEGSWGSWAVEVKTGPCQTRDLRGLLEFVAGHPKFKPVLICDNEGLDTAERVGIRGITWRDYLIKGL